MVQSFFDIENRREFIEDNSRRHEKFPYKLNKISNRAESFFGSLVSAKKLVEKGKDPKEINIGYFYRLSEFDDSVLELVQSDDFQFGIHSFMDLLYSDQREIKNHFITDLPIKRNSDDEKRINNVGHKKYFYDESVKRINEKPRHLREFSGKYMNEFNSLYVGNGFRHSGNFISFLNKGQEMEYECNAFVLPEDKEAEFLNSIESVKYAGVKQVPEIPRDAKNWFFTNGWSAKTDAYLLNFNDGKKPMVAYLHDSICGEAYTEGELLIGNKEGEKVTSVSSEKSIESRLYDNRVMIDDLNELELGLGDKVLSLLNGHNSIYGLRKAENKMTALLADAGFILDEIYVDKGSRRKKSLTTAFRDDASAYQFADQFDM